MRNKIAQLTSFIISILLSLSSVINVIILRIDNPSENYVLGTESTITIVVQLILIVLIVKNLDIWKYLYLILILLSYTPYVDISFYYISILGINIIPTTLLVLHLSFNTEIISALLKQIKYGESDEKKILEKKNSQAENKISRFMSKYSDKSVTELEEIASDKNYDRFAREAAKRLIDK